MIAPKPCKASKTLQGFLCQKTHKQISIPNLPKKYSKSIDKHMFYEV